MAEPEKPFACPLPDCGMTFTNEDRLHVHTKKHDMLLQFGMEQKSAFVADQTPTPTRFIRNCEEVGLFQDLQHVNPFDEGFKRAVETKQGVLSLEGALLSSDDALHTPQMMFPIDTGDSAQFTTTNNHRNITISRSSSDESGAVKEYETTTISKLTNEVTTISRIVDKSSEEMKSTDPKDNVVNETVSYTNNVIKIHSNLEIRKDGYDARDGYSKDVLLTDRIHVEKQPMMSQRSIELVVDSLADVCDKDNEKTDDNYEVIIKLPSGKELKMKTVDDDTKTEAKEKLKAALAEKAERKLRNDLRNEMINLNQSFLPVTAFSGTLFPVKIIQPAKVGIPMNKPTVKRKFDSDLENGTEEKKIIYSKLECRSAASKRYRQRLRTKLQNQCDEIRQLKLANQQLSSELTNLKVLVSQHMKKCPIADELRKPNDRTSKSDENPT